MEQSATTKSRFSPLSILGGLAGYAIGAYSNGMVLFPLFAAALVHFALKRLCASKTKAFRSAVAIHGGYLLWIALGIVVLVVSSPPGMRSALELLPPFCDLLALSVGIGLFFYSPTIRGSYLLGSYDLVSLSLNSYRLALTPFGSPEHRVLTVHVVWVAVSLWLIFVFLRPSNADSAR